MYLMTSTRHGVAAKEIERQIGVTYKCAWRMCHELRKLMATADAGGQIGGPGKHVEIDETLVGGVVHGKGPGQRRENKTVIMGMVEREGRVIAGPVPNTTKATLEPLVYKHVARGSTLSTDEAFAYGDLHLDLEHGTVVHSAKEYVRGIHHINSLESHWSLFKRAVRARTFTFRASTLGNMFRSSRIAATCGTRIGDVQSFGSGFRAAARNRAVKSSRWWGFSSFGSSPDGASAPQMVAPSGSAAINHL